MKNLIHSKLPVHMGCLERKNIFLCVLFNWYCCRDFFSSGWFVTIFFHLNEKESFFFKEIIVLILREITCQCNVLDIVEVFFFALEIMFYLNDTFFVLILRSLILQVSSSEFYNPWQNFKLQHFYSHSSNNLVFLNHSIYSYIW